MHLLSALCLLAILQDPPPRPPEAKPQKIEAPEWASFSDEEMAVVAEINRIRRFPKAYGDYLKKELLPLLDANGKTWRLPAVPGTTGGRMPIRLQEGRPAIEEAIRFLETVEPCPPLIVSDTLAKAAQDHVRAQGPTGETGHKGPDGSRPVDRIERHGDYGTLCGEIINYGTERPRMTVLQLVIDDGVPDRGHRKAIFNPEYKLAGPAMGAHKTYVSMTVVTLADSYTPKKAK